MCFGYWTSITSPSEVVAGSFKVSSSNMTQLIRLGWLFLMICFVTETISTCESPYLDLCGYNATDYNSTEIEDDNEVDICNCEQVTFCSLVELTEECDSATIILKTDANVLSTQLQCSVSAFDFQGQSPGYKILKKNENEFEVKIFTEFNFGKYKIICNILETPDEAVSLNQTQWNIISMYPTEVLIDSQITLQLTVVDQSEKSSCSAWCFIKTPDGSIELLSSSWTTQTEVDCSFFRPLVPGSYAVSLSTTMTPSIFDKSASVKVNPKNLTPVKAEYSFDFQMILIYFDGNIELRSTCANVFSKKCREFFGTGFECIVRGNTLFVKMGVGFKITNKISISAENQICQAGSETCLPVPPTHLKFSKPKASGSDLSLYLNSACDRDSVNKHMNIIVKRSSNLGFVQQDQTVKHRTQGKSQRRNIMMWRKIRQVQRKLSPVILQFNETNVNSIYECLPSVENILNGETKDLGSLASVTINVESSPGCVLAEAEVTFCPNSFRLYRFKWIVNGEDVNEDGKLLILGDLPPGKCVIKCMVIAHNSSDVLGQGWTTTEILPAAEKVIIVPLETTAALSDDVSLSAVTWQDSSVSWTCRKEPDEPCLTTDKKFASDVIDLNSPKVLIPAGTFPTGIYLWAVDIGKSLNEARVVIKDGNATGIGVETPSVFVESSQEIILRGVVGSMRSGCRTWWSSVRHRGFDYFPLNTTIQDSLAEDNIRLVIPTFPQSGPDSLYLFQFQVFCPYDLNNPLGSFDYMKLPVVVSSSPRVSPLFVHPLNGNAMNTKFAISGGNADSPSGDYPLTYEWSYVDPCDAEVSIKRSGFLKNFTTYLPPGDIKLLVKVCDRKKMCSTVFTPTISVSQESELPKNGFRDARNEIEKLLTSGDTMEGFGLTMTVFKSLALLAEPGIRQEIFTTVEEAIKIRIKILRKRAKSEPKSLNSCLEFFEQAMAVAKHFRKGSSILDRLMEFKRSVLKDNSTGKS